LKLIKVL